MADDENEKGKSSGGSRGASYPFISLKDAIERARSFFEYEGKNAAPVAAAVEHWGYGAKSSGGRQTIAAMLQYGLMRDEGSGEQRRVALTKTALDILLADSNSEEHREAVRAAGRSPKLFREILAKYPDVLPSDTTLRHYLITERDISTSAVSAVIKNLRDTVAYAGLIGSASIPATPATNPDPPPRKEPRVGDLIQWESAGVLQFETPRRVRAVQQDWVFVDGSNTGIPMAEVTVEGRAAEQPPKATPPVLPEDPREREWIRGPLSKDISYRIMVSGDLGPKEISKLIRLLEAQRLVLSDDPEESQA